MCENPDTPLTTEQIIEQVQAQKEETGMSDTPEQTPDLEFVTETYSIPAQWIVAMTGTEVIYFDDLLNECEVIEESAPTEPVYQVTVRAPLGVIEKLRLQVALWASKYDTGQVDDSIEHTAEIIAASYGVDLTGMDFKVVPIPE